MLITKIENKITLVPGKLYQIADDGEMLAWPYNKRGPNCPILVNKNHVLHFLKIQTDTSESYSNFGPYLFVIQGDLHQIYKSNIQLRTFKELI